MVDTTTHTRPTTHTSTSDPSSVPEGPSRHPGPGRGPPTVSPLRDPVTRTATTDPAPHPRQKHPPGTHLVGKSVSVFTSFNGKMT